MLTRNKPTDVKTSSVCCTVAILLQLNFLRSISRVGLLSVADGCVLKKVGNLCLSDSAGELEP